MLIQITQSHDYSKYFSNVGPMCSLLKQNSKEKCLPFIVKFSTAFSGLIIGFGLKLIKYVPNATQTASTIFGMKVIMFLIPAILMVLCAVVYSKCYKLHGKFYSDVMKSLEKRREKAAV